MFSTSGWIWSLAFVPARLISLNSNMNAVNTTAPKATPEVRRLRDLSPQQWKSGIAAWLGWLFDGLDMHLYGLVAAPFVALLLGLSATDTANALVREKTSWIQA